MYKKKRKLPIPSSPKCDILQIENDTYGEDGRNEDQYHIHIFDKKENIEIFLYVKYDAKKKLFYKTEYFYSHLLIDSFSDGFDMNLNFNRQIILSGSGQTFRKQVLNKEFS